MLRIIICIFLISPEALIAQKSDFQSGARSEAMGHASAALSDPWAVFNNIGALAGNENFSMGFSYKSQFAIEGFNSAALCMNVPLDKLNVGVGLSHFGDETFSENKASLGAAHRINFVGLGVNINYLQYNISGFGTRSAVILELGGIVEIAPGMTLAAHFFNLNQASLSGKNRTAVPSLMQIGFSYHPDEKLTAVIEAEKENYFDPNIKAGLEYAILDQLLIRTGFSTFPRKGYFGIGLKTARFDIDFSVASHRALGISQQLGINYKLGGSN